ncbi:MAG: hypothetical protein ACE149_11240 [Armatimonadota bacterium]
MGPAAEPAIGERPPVFAREATTGRFDLAAHLGQRPVVLLFLPDMADPNCAGYAKAFANNADHYRGLSAAVAVITMGPTGGRELPGMVIVPEAAALFDLYGLAEGGSARAAVVIVDRYGQVHAVYRGDGCTALPPEATVARVLLGAESVCPECGVPEKHWQEAGRPNN